MTARRPIRIMPRVIVAAIGLPIGAVAELWLAIEIGTATYGVYAGLVALARVMAAIASRGSESGIVRMRTEFPGVHPGAILRWTMLQTGPLSLIGAIVVVAIIVSTGHQALAPAALLLAICPMCTLVATMQGSMTADGQTGRAIIPNSLVQPLGIAVGAGLIISGWCQPTVESAAWIGFGSWLFAMMAACVLTMASRSQSEGTSLNSTQRRVCRQTLGHFTLLTVGNQILARTDVALLGLFGSPSATGLYAIISKITGVMLVGMQAAASAMRPHFGAYHRDSKLDALAGPMRRVRAIGVSWAVAVTGIGTLFLALGHQLSDQFDPLSTAGWCAFAALCIAQFVIVITGPLSAALNQTGHANRVAWLTLGISGAAIVAQAVAAPWGALPMAVTTMASRITLRLGLLRVARTDHQLLKLFLLRVRA